MAEFIVNEDVETDVPTVEVTVTAAAPLPLGRHRFRLIVIDNSGNASMPDEVDVIVADQERPTAVLEAPSTVAFGKSFPLSGRRSVDAGGGVVTRWVWTYLGPSPR